ncbi:MAG: GTPase HflX [Candidatus Muiribacteriota bacterium]
MKKGIIVSFRKIKESSQDFEEHLSEMCELTRSAKIKIVDIIKQTDLKSNPKTYLNKGKINQIAGRIKDSNIDFVIFSNELSSLQYKNILEIFPADTEIVDRAELIFFIFLQNAQTSLGKRKVELAQLEYELTKMTGKGKSMSRLGAGIGTKGLGEQKKELDKRYIKTRIKNLKERIKKDFIIKKEQRKNRLNSNIPLVSLVGYTNVGKTSLMNAMLKKNDGYVRNKYFATLEPKCKKVYLNSSTEILVNDSVGFISELPEKLFEAFMSTIEEIKFSDLLVIVLSPYEEKSLMQKQIILNTLKQLNCENKPYIIVKNKSDLVSKNEYPYISAKKDLNIKKLKKNITEVLND